MSRPRRAVETCPSAEWAWVVELTWAGKVVDRAPGGLRKGAGGQTLWRRARPVDTLLADGARLILESMDVAATDALRGMSLEVVQDKYDHAGLIRAEVVALRLYTGPAFAFYNGALRARGELGWRRKP